MIYKKANYSANEVAKEIIKYSNKCGRPVSNLKLQKILYFVQAIFLNELGRACFDDRIEAWSFGPVIPSVYHDYKIFGAGRIPVNYFNNNSFANKFAISSSGFNVPLSIEDKKTIDEIVEYFSKFSASELVDITHHQDPWVNAYVPKYNNEITKESIIEYFSKLKRKKV